MKNEQTPDVKTCSTTVNHTTATAKNSKKLFTYSFLLEIKLTLSRESR